MLKRRCVCLYSGGLDSILAVKLIQEQGIDVISICFCSPLFGFDALRDPESYKIKQLEEFNINVHVVDFTDEILRIVKEPKYGFGRHMNPCIDCKIGMLIKAKGLMDTLDASFIITGEILGQRPMSQRRDAMNVIEKQSGVKDLLLRPLCALHMKETLPERMGIIDRQRLKDIAGRGRKVQMEMAGIYEIKRDSIPTPAGGCLLADERIAHKIRDTYERSSPALPERYDIMMDVIGRKFILDKDTVIVISRNEKENRTLSTMRYPGNIFMKIMGVPGPLCIFRGNAKIDNLEMAAGICLRYSKGKARQGLKAVYGDDPERLDKMVKAPVLEEDICKSFQIDLKD